MLSCSHRLSETLLILSIRSLDHSSAVINTPPEIKVHLRADAENYCPSCSWKKHCAASPSKRVYLSCQQPGHFPFCRRPHSQVWHLNKSHSSIKNGCVHVWLSLKAGLQLSELVFATTALRIAGGGEDHVLETTLPSLRSPPQRITRGGERLRQDADARTASGPPPSL